MASLRFLPNRKELTRIIRDVFPELYVANLTTKGKAEEDCTRKEAYRAMPLMNVDTNILSKIKIKIANKIQQYRRIIIHHGVPSREEKLTHFPKNINVVHWINRLKKKKIHVIIAINAGRVRKKTSCALGSKEGFQGMTDTVQVCSLEAESPSKAQV
jgi:hypothetical protein